jgi:F-type H+-transporting ATPase subunit delta
VKLRLLTHRYAVALLDNIEEKNYDDLLLDIEALRSFLKDNGLLSKLWQSAITPRKMRTSLLEEVFGKQAKSGIVLNQRKYWYGLFSLLIQKHRIPLVEEIINDIERLLLQRQNKAKIKIVYAREHKPELQDKIVKYTEKLTSKELIPQTEIDPGIIGGFIAQVGSLKIDGSVRHNLDLFKKVKSRS